MPPKKDQTILAAVDLYYKAMMEPREIQVRISKEYGVAERTVRKYIVEVEKRYAMAMTPEQRARSKVQMRATCRAGIARAISRKDEKSADRWAERLCKLDGLYAPQEISLGGAVGTIDLAPVRSADRRGRLQELLAKARAGGS